MNNQPIGILDSGVGGLTVWKEISELLPQESTVYIGDSLNSPYGRYSADYIVKLSKKLINFLLDENVKLIVIACNTITVSCLDKLRREYPKVPIIGIVPVVKTAALVTKNHKIGILSTTNTATSEYQKNLIKQFATGCKVYSHGTDDLVPLIEKGEFSGNVMEKVLNKVLPQFKNEGVDTLALGCTHFPFIRQQIQGKLGKDVNLLDSGTAIARQVKRVLEKNNSMTQESKSKYEFFTTGTVENFEKVANTLGKGTITQKVKSIAL
jgi:glutamate racemase